MEILLFSVMPEFPDNSVKDAASDCDAQVSISPCQNSPVNSMHAAVPDCFKEFQLHCGFGLWL
jgi:hypothetical protein